MPIWSRSSPPPCPRRTVQQPPQRAAQHPTDTALHCQSRSSAVPRRQTATRRAMATNPAIQTKNSKNAVGVRSAPAGLKNRSNWPARPQKKKHEKKHLPAHHPNTNKLTTTEQKQSQEKVDKTAEKRRAATTAVTQSCYDSCHSELLRQLPLRAALTS